jgi:predicted DsbA family dithiol-disulfide isomerase
MKYFFSTALLTLGLLLYAKFSPIQKETKTMSNDKIQIEIWSDVVCPFCLVGKKKLEQAIEKQNAQNHVKIIWRSFQLDPEFPKDKAVPSMKNLTERKGYPAEQVVAMCGQLTASGKPYGIDFNFDAALTFNTSDAHRLIHWAKKTNKSHDLKEALMTAHFSLGKDLSKDSELASVAKSIGLDSTKAMDLLASDTYTTEVAADISKAQSIGVRGVPFFLIDGKQGISGAQSDAVFEDAIKNIMKDRSITTDTSEAGVCLPSGECK